MSGAHAAADDAWKPRANPWLIAVVVTLAAFMEILDTTIVNVTCRTSPEPCPSVTMKLPGL